tara:strand:+ start:235 stop:504 length:270 start_codon:yes stop_codon:yes gene_type:complete
MDQFISENIWWLGWVGIFFIFWFFILRPKLNAQKEEESFRKSLEKGQKIITIGGIHGRILGVKEDTVLIEIEGGGRMKIEKTAILKNKQ